MSRPLLGLICPTIGRPTLARTLASVRAQASPAEVEVLVVGDTHLGPLPEAESMAARFGARYLEHSTGGCTWGHAQRNAAMPETRGRWLASLDDDDVWAPDAFRKIAAGIEAGPRAPHIFRMQYANGRTLWRRQAIEDGNVGTPQFVVPNDPERLGVWSSEYAGDLAFIRSTVALHARPGFVSCVWDEDVIAEIRPVGVPA